MQSSHEFDHDRLRVYQVACEFLEVAQRILDSLPRGESEIRDQLKRAADRQLLTIAEGAGRSGGRDKARFYDYARGSAQECAAVFDVLRIRRLSAARDLELGRGLLNEIVSMLTVMARNARARAG